MWLRLVVLLLGWAFVHGASSRRNTRGWIRRNSDWMGFFNTPRGGTHSDLTPFQETAAAASEADLGMVPPAVSYSYHVSVCAVQGGRNYMEDEHYVSQDGDFAAVFDGHGGQAVSRYLRQNLYANLQAALPSSTVATTSSTVARTAGRNNVPTTTTTTTTEEKDSGDLSKADTTSARGVPTVEDYQIALRQGLEKVDREVQRISHWSYQGSTAVAVWLHEEKHDSTTTSSPHRTIVAANVGDSRAVLSRAGTAMDLTMDHKPNEPLEKARVEALGGKVVWCGVVDSKGIPVKDGGVYRINGNLALSRAIGDRSELPFVSAEPEITVHVLDQSDEFLILGSDGLWDVMSSQEVVSFVHSKLDSVFGDDISDSSSGEQEHSEDNLERLRTNMASLVASEALRRGTMDNVSVIIIWLNETEKL